MIHLALSIAAFLFLAAIALSAVGLALQFIVFVANVMKESK